MVASLPDRSNDQPTPPRRRFLAAWCLVLLLDCAATVGVAQEEFSDRPADPSLRVAAATRLIPLYYTRNTERVISMVRDPVTSPAAQSTSIASDRLERLAEQRRRLLARQMALRSKPAAAAGVLRQAVAEVPLNPISIDQDSREIDLEFKLLDDQEQALRAELFRDESRHTEALTPLVSRPIVSDDAIDRVRITVVGEGLLHLRGPLEGVNAITRMIHEIDKPVGEVKIGIHVIQFTGSDDTAFEGVNGAIDRYLSHARLMSRTSQSLFRIALGHVAARYHAAHPQRFEDAFFYGPCVQNFCLLSGTQTPITLAMLDSRDIVNTLYLVGLANQEARSEVLTEFRRLVATELPRLHEEYQRVVLTPHTRVDSNSKTPSFFARLTRSKPEQDPDSLHPPRVLDHRFAQTMTMLETFGEQAESVNPIQVATARFQRALLGLREAEAAVAAMRNDRLLLALSSPAAASHRRIETVSGSLIDNASFAKLADHVIEQQEAHVLDLREVVRAEVAAVDTQLKRLTTAFESDLRSQFYKPVIEDLRRHSSVWKSRMGQIQSTTVLTHDRVRARVSPGQVAVLDRPIRPVLLQEGLQVAHGLAREAQSLSQTAGMIAASDAVLPSGSAILAQACLAPTPGQHLGATVGQSERIAVSVGDDISVTPVIQPDGFSVAFHLVYTHTPKRDAPDPSSGAAGVQRHLVESDVHIGSLEWQEVSRFRVLMDNEEQGKGIPLLEDIPTIGAAFRPRRAGGSTTQENIILVEAVVYPTAIGLAEKSWLAVDAVAARKAGDPPTATRGERNPRSELTDWVAKTLRSQTHAGRAEPNVPHQGSGVGETMPASAETPIRR
jgi:hypothetical protein